MQGKSVKEHLQNACHVILDMTVFRS